MNDEPSEPSTEADWESSKCEWTFPPKRPGKPRLPWKRGPRAYEIANRALDIFKTLNSSPRAFYSLRRVSKIFGISTQPVRDWIRLRYLKRDGPRLQISRAELERFVKWLVARAEPFDPLNYLDRIELNRENPHRPWRKLKSAEITWPKGRKTLSPSELARLAKCHPSLVTKALRAGAIRGYRPSPGRWQIKPRLWWLPNFS